MEKEYYGRKVEVLDIDVDNKENNKKVKRKLSLKPLKRKLNIDSFKPVFIVAIFVFAIFTTLQYFLGWDLFQIYESKVTPEYKTTLTTYTLAKDGKNLTFYNDNTFKYIADTVVLTGNYTKNAVAYTLTVDKETCPLEIKNQVLVTNCNMLLSQNEIDKKSTMSSYQKIFFLKENKAFDSMAASFIKYVNGLSVVNKWPTLKSSEIISIDDCYTDNGLKNLACQVTYYVEPSDDVNKSSWKENGIVVGTKIKKEKLATFKKTADSYEFVS